MLNAAKHSTYAVIFPGLLRTNVITSSLISRLASLIGLSVAPISQRSGFKSQQAYLFVRPPFGNCISCVFIWDLMIVFAYIQLQYMNSCIHYFNISTITFPFCYRANFGDEIQQLAEKSVNKIQSVEVFTVVVAVVESGVGQW